MSDYYPSTDSEISPEEMAEICELAAEQLRSRGPPYKSWDELVAEVTEGDDE